MSTNIRVAGNVIWALPIQETSHTETTTAGGGKGGKTSGGQQSVTTYTYSATFALLLAQGIEGADGEVWLHCYPRVLGHTFKPVSFWYCHRPDGQLRAIVVEVNNTFGERHCYLLDAPRFGVEQRAAKVFHVSPFCPVEGGYRFRFMVDPTRHRTVGRIDYDDASGPLLQTSVCGTLQALDARTTRQALWRYPAMTLGVVLRIHWQALKLFAKRVPFFNKPVPPTALTTR